MPSNGFILVDSLYRPVYADPESIKILGFPHSISTPESLDGILTHKILSFLSPSIGLAQGGAAVTQFQSGRRRYLCRAFVLENHWNGASGETRIALILERGLPGPPANPRKQRMLAGMYADPYGFSPDPKYFSPSRSHQEVFGSLRNLVRESRGIGVLFAQAGMGKTLLLNYLAEYLQAESVIAIFPGSFENRTDLVRAVMATLGIACPGKDLPENLARLEAWLLSKNLSGQRVLLICDDAQDYTLDTLENLCLLSDLQIGQQKLIQIVLAGRQGLLAKLSGQQLKEAGGRINLFCRLAPLDEAEVRSYVLHRLQIAGCTRPLFNSEALSSIALYSRGIPLNVNMICRHSLSLAAAVNLQIVDERTVADAAYDLVLRATPAYVGDGLVGVFSTEAPKATMMRDRRGLRLVQKP